HVAHVQLARAALEQLALDDLKVLPTGQAWHKTRQLTSADHRLAMTRLAFGKLDRTQVDEREIRRSGPTYTIDTVSEILAEQPGSELFVVMGEDQAIRLPTWRNWEALLGLAKIAVVPRVEDPSDPPLQEPTFVPQPGVQDRFIRLAMPLTPLSATAIRQRLSAGETVAPLVGEAVARYIDQHHLYQST
ncbi:MAG: nicotinate-nucleotide adenylyltransferase NadD, partial [Pseudomonadota bacterium]